MSTRSWFKLPLGWIEITVIWGPLHRYLFKETTLLLTLYTKKQWNPPLCTIHPKSDLQYSRWEWTYEWCLKMMETGFANMKVLHSEGSFLHIFTVVNSATHSPYDLENSSKTPPIRTSTLTRKSGKCPYASFHLSPKPYIHHKPCLDQCQAIFPTKEQSHQKPLSPFSSSKLGY